MIQRVLCIFYLLLIAFAKAYALPDNFRFVHININNGLSNSSVNCFYQDHLGFIWIGTENGLNKYDGRNFQVFRHDRNPSSISNDKINCVFEDSRHFILAGTNQGISILDRSTNSFKNLILNAPVNVIFEDAQKNNWFGTDHGELHLLDPVSFKSTLFLNNEANVHLSSNAINSIAEDNNGNLLIARGGTGLNIFSVAQRKFTQYYKKETNDLSDNYIQSLFFDKKKNVLWIGTKRGLDKFDVSKKIFKNYKNTEYDLQHLYSIAMNKDGNLWIGTESNGVFVFDPAKESFKSIKSNSLNVNSLSNNQIRNLYIDNEGNIWIGCYRVGINLLTNTKNFSFYQYTQGEKQTLNNKTVLSVIEDRNKNLWIGTEGGGLNFLNRKTGAFTYYKQGGNNSLSDNTVQSLYEDKEGKIWIGTYSGGISILNPHTNKFTYFKDPDSVMFRGSNDIRAITGDENGNVWIASNGNGISKFTINGKRIANYRTDWQNRNRTLVTNWIRSIYIDKKNMVWVGTVTGITIFDPSKEDYKNINKDGEEDLTVYSFCEDGDGNMWVGTTLGLKKYNPESHSFKTFTIADGLPDNIINGILKDDNNNLWISTNNGLCAFNYKTEKAVNFDLADGLPDNNFIISSFFKGAKGQMYFGSNDGLLYFSPNKIKTSTFIPPITLTDFRVYNKSVKIGDMDSLLKRDISATKEIILNYDQSFFAFEYAAPNYANPKKNQYRYKLIDFDKEWVYNGSSNIASYTDIAPGTYTFVVNNSVENGIWNPYPVSIRVIVLPPFWLTGWAYFCYFLIIVLSLYFSRQFIINREKLKNDLKLEKMKSEKAEEMNSMKLNFFTNVSHEFKTPLTLIMGPIEQLRKKGNTEEEKEAYYELIHNNSQRLLNLINEVLDLNKMDSGKLQIHKEKSDVVHFIRNIATSFHYVSEQKKIHLKISAQQEPLYFVFDPEKLEKILVNLLSNAFKFTKEYGLIEVSIKKENDCVVISVKDNGSGIEEKDLPHIFERFYKAENQEANAEGTGIGLAFVKELVELHNGKIEVESKVGEGASFHIYLPITGENVVENSVLPANKLVAPEQESGKIKILIIEDNPEVRSFLKNELEKLDYLIEEAQNGKVGLEKAFQILPDMIISDVMMPEMDGTEVCKQLKTDIRTSHIPVILLTAKSSTENQLKGFETGADAYVTKPYNLSVLQLQIKNILSFREKLRKKVSVDTMIDAKEITVTNADEALMEKAMQIIEKNIADTEFSVNKFAAEIGIGRTLFYAKIKNITGQTVNEFIQTIRLKHAARMLLKSDDTIAEIAYSVGFNTPNYFSKCFKDAYGVHPSQYREENKKV